MQLNNLGQAPVGAWATSHHRLFEQSPVQPEAFSHSHFPTPFKATGPQFETSNRKTETRLDAYEPVSISKTTSPLSLSPQRSLQPRDKNKSVKSNASMCLRM